MHVAIFHMRYEEGVQLSKINGPGLTPETVGVRRTWRVRSAGVAQWA